MTSFEELTDSEQYSNESGDNGEIAKMLAKDTSEIIAKLKAMGLYREEDWLPVKATSGGEDDDCFGEDDPMIVCPICQNDSYNTKTGCCEICDYDGVVWDDDQYHDFFEFEDREYEYDEDSYCGDYKITGVNDRHCPLPNPFFIPEEYIWDSITKLDVALFLEDQRLESVVIPKTIEVIGANAFSGCRNLKQVTILGSSYISKGAFDDCCRLQDVYLSDNVTFIGCEAFSSCTSLQTLIIPKSVERIGSRAFWLCSKLRNVVILNPEIVIESNAFEDCPNISEVTIPLSLASQIDTLFEDSKNDKRITWVEQTITSHEERAVNICFNELTQDDYTDGTTGWTIKFSLENNNNGSIIVSVADIFLISDGKIHPRDFWLQGHRIDELRLFPNEAANVAAIFLEDNYDGRNFEEGALVGLELEITDNARNEDRNEEMRESYLCGDDINIADLPIDGPFTAVFRNLGNSWHLIATNIPKKSNKSDVVEIEFANFVVRTNTFNCNLNHSVETVEAVVSVLAADGSIFKTSTMAGYCRHCNCYFLLETDFIALQQKGKLLCQLLTWEEYTTKGQSIFNGEDMKAESVLKRCGYNVNATENLSAEQRQKILALVLDNGLYTAPELCNFLDWLINYHGRSKTRNMSAAISKWTEDRRFVLTHNWSDRRKVGVGSITYKK